MPRPFLILQLRSLDAAADDEFEAFINYGQLSVAEVKRVRMEKESFGHLNPQDFSGVIVGGGPSNVSDEEDSKPDYQRRFESELNILYDKIFEQDIPYLGSCYGLGSIMRYAGGEVSKKKYSEGVGSVEIRLLAEAMRDPITEGLPLKFDALVGHKEACQTLPEGAVLLGESDACPIQMVRFKRNIYATQFHCELDAKGIEVRIKVYKNHGYFEPADAEKLIRETGNVVAEIPQQILGRFVNRYRA